MTARYPFRTGLQHTVTLTPGTMAAIPADTSTIAEVLKNAGYSTHAIGKVSELPLQGVGGGTTSTTPAAPQSGKWLGPSSAPPRAFGSRRFATGRRVATGRSRISRGPVRTTPLVCYMSATRLLHTTFTCLLQWHLGYAGWQDTPLGRGFDSYAGYLQGAEDYYTHQFGFKGLTGYDLWRNKTVAWDANGKHSTSFFMEEAQRVLDSRDASTPMFMYFAHQEIHAHVTYVTGVTYVAY